MKPLAWIIIVLQISLIFCHSYVTDPVTRSKQFQTQTGRRGTGPCDATKDAAGNTAPISVQRGQSLTIKWPRNNHPAGFIRLAIAQRSQSDTYASFDQGIVKTVCHELPCAPGSAQDPNGGDGPNTVSCATNMSIPTHLADGSYTIQWLWYGGGYALADYYSCIDVNVAGGASQTTTAAPAVFQGGDYTYPGQNKCKWFNTNIPYRCTQEPCNNVVQAGQQSGTPGGEIVPPSPSSPSNGTSSGGGSSTGGGGGDAGNAGSPCNLATDAEYICYGCDLARCVFGKRVLMPCAPGTICKNGICDFGSKCEDIATSFDCMGKPYCATCTASACTTCISQNYVVSNGKCVNQTQVTPQQSKSGKVNGAMSMVGHSHWKEVVMILAFAILTIMFV